MSIRVAVRWLVILVPALLIYFAPLPVLNPAQRHLLAIFVGTILALVAQPVPMAVSVLVAMTTLVLTNTLPPAKALSGFGNPTVWMVFSAFLFARAVTDTGFGLRIAYLFIRRFGHSALTLGYSVTASDVALAPFVPSDTARGGGIIYPIARSLSRVFDSEPGPTSGRIGSFLMLVGFHSTYTASAMFLTGMVANPLIAEFARKLAHVELTWIQWALAASLPGLLTLTIVPYLIYRLNPPEIKDTRAAQRLAIEELRRMGPLSVRERWLVAILLCVMAGWVTSPWHVRQRVCPHGRMVVAGGRSRAGRQLSLRALRIRRHDGPHHCPVSRVSDRGLGGRRATSVNLAAIGVLLESRRGHHALRHWLRPRLFRCGLRVTDNLVAAGVSDIASESDHLAGPGSVMVEASTDMVRRASTRRHNRRESQNRICIEQT